MPPLKTIELRLEVIRHGGAATPCGAIAEIFDLRPRAIIDALDLKRPIYAKTAAHGHFGRDDPDFTWERLDRVDDLKAYFNA